MAVTVDVDLNRAQIYALLTNRAGRIGRKVARHAEFRAPKDTGRLAGSIVVVVGSAPGFAYADIGSNLPYAIWRHEGTGIYGRGAYITPRTAKVLRWRAGRRSSGRRPEVGSPVSPWVYRPRAKGTPGVPFLVDALDAVVGGVARIRRFRGRGRR